MQFVWIPEHPDSRLGLYRVRHTIYEGKLGTITRLWTTDPCEALCFSTKDECEAWIIANPKPKWVAREHGFMGQIHVKR